MQADIHPSLELLVSLPTRLLRNLGRGDTDGSGSIIKEEKIHGLFKGVTSPMVGPQRAAVD